MEYLGPFARRPSLCCTLRLPVLRRGSGTALDVARATVPWSNHVHVFSTTRDPPPPAPFFSRDPFGESRFLVLGHGQLKEFQYEAALCLGVVLICPTLWRSQLVCCVTRESRPMFQLTHAHGVRSVADTHPPLSPLLPVYVAEGFGPGGGRSPSKYHLLALMLIGRLDSRIPFV